MATSLPLLSIDEYLHTSYKPDVHFVDGELEERNVGEHTHNFVQSFLTALFSVHEDDWKLEVIPEQRIQVRSNLVRVCDLTIIGSDTPWEEVLSIPPIACIEIKSPEDRLSRAERVLADYFAMGVPHIWLIDPYRRRLYSHNGTGMHEMKGCVLVFRDRPVRIDLATLFAKLDRKVAANRL